ncbi:MAG: hypothetical protein GEU80_14965 [Dehalococcoidia bacterium]|nr:hypothetical protein [Dehalococcoidia bacterium]
MFRACTLLVAAVGVLAVACGGDDGGPDEAGAALADRWLRVGEGLRTSVQVYDRALPPQLAQLLNPGLTPETPPEDVVAVPVHPDGELLGSFHVRREDGVDIVWLVYDVAADDAAVETTVRQQLNETPWQTVGGQSRDGVAVVGFQSTVSGDIEGQAWVQPLPTAAEYDVVVSREGAEQTLQVSRGASVPLLEAEVVERDGGLVLEGLEGGAGQAGGLREGDRIVSVGGRAVSTRDDLEAAYHALRDAGEVRTSVVYVVQIAPQLTAEAPAFRLPPSRTLPEGFPAPFLQADGMTVLEVSWASQPQGRGYQVVLVTDASTSETADTVRAALDDAGWQVTGDNAVGFSTELTVESAGGADGGTITIDVFQGDDSLTAVFVQLQSTAGGAN